MKRVTLSLLLALPLTATHMLAQPITAGQHTRVETAYGTIEGYQDDSIFTFTGVQYAKAERYIQPQAPAEVERVIP